MPMNTQAKVDSLYAVDASMNNPCMHVMLTYVNVSHKLKYLEYGQAPTDNYQCLSGHANQDSHSHHPTCPNKVSGIFFSTCLK